MRRALWLVAACGVALAGYALADPARSLAAGPEAIFARVGLPLAAALVAAGFAALPANGRLVLGSLLLTGGALELASSLGGAPASEVRIETQPARDYYQRDERLGWAPAREGVFSATKRLDGELLYAVEYAIDARGRRVTPVDPSPERLRFLLFFGGSCTFGEGVGAEETLPYFAGQRAPAHVPYNYGFHGYGPQQMLARLEDPAFRAEVAEPEGALVYLFIDAHVLRAIGSMRVYTAWADRAPHYALGADGQAVRHGDFNTGRPGTALLYSLLGRSRTLARLNVDAPLRVGERHLELTAAILARAQELFHERFGPQQRFVVAAFPGSQLAPGLGAGLARRGVELLDYSDLLDPTRPGFQIPHDGHPTALTNRRIAEQLVADLAIAGGPALAERAP